MLGAVKLPLKHPHPSKETGGAARAPGARQSPSVIGVRLALSARAADSAYWLFCGAPTKRENTLVLEVTCHGRALSRSGGPRGASRFYRGVRML